MLNLNTDNRSVNELENHNKLDFIAQYSRKFFVEELQAFRKSLYCVSKSWRNPWVSWFRRYWFHHMLWNISYNPMLHRRCNSVNANRISFKNRFITSVNVILHIYSVGKPVTRKFIHIVSIDTLMTWLKIFSRKRCSYTVVDIHV